MLEKICPVTECRKSHHSGIFVSDHSVPGYFYESAADGSGVATQSGGEPQGQDLIWYAGRRGGGQPGRSRFFSADRRNDDVPIL